MAKAGTTTLVISKKLHKRVTLARDGRTMQATTERVIEAGLKALKASK